MEKNKPDVDVYMYTFLLDYNIVTISTLYCRLFVLGIATECVRSCLRGELFSFLFFFSF